MAKPKKQNLKLKTSLACHPLFILFTILLIAAGAGYFNNAHLSLSTGQKWFVLIFFVSLVENLFDKCFGVSVLAPMLKLIRKVLRN